MRRRGILGMAMLFFFSSVSPSWAWGGGGWGLLAGLGLIAAVNGPWGPYGYPAYAYGPYNAYCYPGYYYPPYAYPRAYPQPPVPYRSPAQSTLSTAPDNARYDLKLIKERLTRMHEQLVFKYEDGDISKAERNVGFHYLDQIAHLARSEYDTNGKYLTARQEQDLLRQIQTAANHDSGVPYPEVTAVAASSPEMSTPASVQIPSERGVPHDSQAMSDLILELRTLLDVKVRNGDITKPQHDAEAAYLDRLAQETHSAALTEDDESRLVQKLHQAYYAISRNLVTD